MFDEEGRSKLYKLLQELEKTLRQTKEYKDCQNRFTRELIDTIATVTYDYFSGRTRCPGLLIEANIREEEIREQIASDKDFKFYGIWIFEELCSCMRDFRDDKIAPGRKLHHKKIEYPCHTSETIEKQIKKFKKDYKMLSSEELETIRRSYEEEAKIDEYYTNFKILLHNTLKKLAVKYFDEIMEISSTGLREIDYLLYSYMLMMYENIMKILQDDIHVSVENPTYDYNGG